MHWRKISISPWNPPYNNMTSTEKRVRVSSRWMMRTSPLLWKGVWGQNASIYKFSVIVLPTGTLGLRRPRF
jgi:hypothetical protein